jgi:hypothetical protein
MSSIGSRVRLTERSWLAGRSESANASVDTGLAGCEPSERFNVKRRSKLMWDQTLPCGHVEYQHRISILGSSPLPNAACLASEKRERVVRESAMESSARLNGQDWRASVVVGDRRPPTFTEALSRVVVQMGDLVEVFGSGPKAGTAAVPPYPSYGEAAPVVEPLVIERTSRGKAKCPYNCPVTYVTPEALIKHHLRLPHETCPVTGCGQQRIGLAMHMRKAHGEEIVARL